MPDTELPVTAEMVNEVMNNLGIAEIVELINAQSTRSSQSVTEVIGMIEKIMEQHRSQQRTQLVGFQAIRGLWHGWRATVKWNGEKHIFGDIPKGVQKEFILSCIEVGTAIAVRQLEKANLHSK